tara:strand:- start:41 stop:961 length:921 start_codon:yes stop_codon:yes gene_type:complete
MNGNNKQLGVAPFNFNESLMDWTAADEVAESTGQKPHGQIDSLIQQSSILNLLSSLMEPAPGINPLERIKEEKTIMRKIGHIPELLMGFGLLTSPQGARKAVTKIGAKGLLKKARKYKNPKNFVEQMHIETSSSIQPGETLLSKEATKKTGLYHGTNPGAIQGILNTGKIQARVSRLDKAGQKSVSVSGNKGVAGSYGTVIFELDPKLKVVEPSAGVVRGDYYKGFEYRHPKDIPISKVKSAFINIGSKENLNTRIFIGWKGNQEIYKTIGELQSQLKSKGINTYVADFGDKSALSDIWQQAQAIK